MERATYEAERAERQYQAVEPENRLVARSLERQWEEALRNRRDLAEEYDRFLKEQPPHLSEDQRARILALSSDLPALWNAPETTAADRKEIIRLVVERVVVHVRAETERGEVVISWRGGATTRHEIVRTVSRYESLGRYDQLMNRIIEMRQEGQTIKQIAAQLNAEGYRTPRSRKGYTSTSVRKLLSRGELTRGRIATRQLDRHEWWLPDLARELQMSANKLRDWARAWLGSLPAGSTARPVGHLGRWAGTTAVAEAPGSLETGQACGRSTVSREGHPLMILDPIDPHGVDRWDRGFVTKGALCRADPGLPQFRHPARHVAASLSLTRSGRLTVTRS